MRLGVTYIPCHLPDHIERDMGELAAIGCDDVLFAIQENHLDTLRGAVDFGPKLAAKLGLRPQAVIWGFLNTFGGGRMSSILLKAPSLWRIGRQGQPQPMVCLNHPEVMTHLRSGASRLRDAGFEMLFIDEPTTQDCFCEHCQRAFARDGGTGPLADAGKQSYTEFQRRTVIDYVRRGCQTVKALDPNMETVCCLMPHDRDCWAAAATLPGLDMLGTDPYWLLPVLKLSFEQALDDTATMKTFCREHGKKSQVWLNGFSIPSGVEEEIYRGGLRLAEVGCDSFFTWSYRGGLGTDEQSARPELVWQQVTKLYRELADR